ncbi:MAG: prepilin-type N-terminal cleavage/methylation domain-containing protein, partial [Actinobacteria bacterium]|nr:prepilin-type N-terminal cleavage/methylation domain-containing protein [Actinomycetota bacterium]
MRNSKCEIRNARSRAAFTLVEVLIVVAILALLAAALVGVSSFITTQRNTALTKNCLDVLDAALAEFRDITGHYPVDDWGVRDTSPGCLIAGATLTSASAPRSSELLYLQLSLLPQTRDIIAKLPDQLLVQPIDTSDILITVELADQPGTP